MLPTYLPNFFQECLQKHRYLFFWPKHELWIFKSTLTIVSASFILWHSYIYKVHLYVYIGWCNGHASSRKTSELYKSLANLTFKEVTDKVDLYYKVSQTWLLVSHRQTWHSVNHRQTWPLESHCQTWPLVSHWQLWPLVSHWQTWPLVSHWQTWPFVSHWQTGHFVSHW